MNITIKVDNTPFTIKQVSFIVGRNFYDGLTRQIKIEGVSYFLNGEIISCHPLTEFSKQVLTRVCKGAGKTKHSKIKRIRLKS